MTWKEWFDVEDFELEDWVMTGGVVFMVAAIFFLITR